MKKIFVITLLITLSLSLLGCGDAENTDSGQARMTETTEPATENVEQTKKEPVPLPKASVSLVASETLPTIDKQTIDLPLSIQGIKDQSIRGISLQIKSIPEKLSNTEVQVGECTQGWNLSKNLVNKDLSIALIGDGLSTDCEVLNITFNIDGSKETGDIVITGQVVDSNYSETQLDNVIVKVE